MPRLHSADKCFNLHLWKSRSGRRNRYPCVRCRRDGDRRAAESGRESRGQRRWSQCPFFPDGTCCWRGSLKQHIRSHACLALHPPWLPIAQRFKVGVMAPLPLGLVAATTLTPHALAHAVRGLARAHTAVYNYLIILVIIGSVTVLCSAVNPEPFLVCSVSSPRIFCRDTAYSQRVSG